MQSAAAVFGGQVGKHLPSYSLSCWVAYSSMGSTMYSTSMPLFFTRSTNEELATTSLLSPAQQTFQYSGHII